MSAKSRAIRSSGCGWSPFAVYTAQISFPLFIVPMAERLSTPLSDPPLKPSCGHPSSANRGFVERVRDGASFKLRSRSQISLAVRRHSTSRHVTEWPISAIGVRISTTDRRVVEYVPACFLLYIDPGFALPQTL